MSRQTEQRRRTCAIKRSRRSRIQTSLQTPKSARLSPPPRWRPSLVPQVPSSRILWVHWIVSRWSQLTIARFHTGDMEPSTGNHRRPPVRFRNSQAGTAGTKILDSNPPIPSPTFLLRSILLPQPVGAVVAIHLPRPRWDRVMYSHHTLLLRHSKAVD